MGFLKKLTKTPKFLRPLLGNTWLDEVGTVGGFVVGGPGGAAAGRGLGKFAATGDLTKGLMGAAEGYTMGRAGNLAKLARTAAGREALKGAIFGTSKGSGSTRGSTIPGAKGGKLAPITLPNRSKSGGIAGDVWDWMKGNPDLVLAGLQTVQDARDSGRARSLQDRAISMAMQDRADRAPLREAALKLLPLASGGGNLASVFSDPGNPYAR